MVTAPENEDVLFLGIDGGGSKCRALLIDQNNQKLGVGYGGPSNPYHDTVRAFESIDYAINEALHVSNLNDSDKSRLVVGMGLAGVNIPSLFNTVNQSNHPYRARYLTSDLHIASVGAHQHSDGAVIVVGTGSCGFAHVKERTLNLGGHGFPCGDKGSGAWLGLSAVQAVLLSDNNLGPSTVLSELIAEHLHVNGILIVEALNGAKSSDYAALAPLVFEASESGDAIAEKILLEGADYLSSMALQLLDFGAKKLAMIGGVSKRFSSWMRPEVVSHIQAPLNQPEYGAVLYAKAQFYANTGSL